MSILMTSDLTGFFNDAVDEAFAAQRLEASRGAREYLVGVLVDFARRGGADQALKRPVTFLLNEALQAPPAERFEKLRGLGDSSLYVTGMFQEHLEARGVDIGYVSSVGATAYNGAAAMLKKGDGGGLDLFGELAGKFQRLVAVLREVADGIFSGGHDPGSILRLYERWQRTGSQKLGRELAARGLVPLKPSGGVQ
jgi:hypothetical protein